MELDELKMIARKNESSPKDKYIYVVLSSTPLIMGKLIRMVTNYKYNHVSLALSEDISRMYAFARHYGNAPLCGGFVTESPLRFEKHGEYGVIKIFALPVPEAVAGAVAELFNDMSVHNDKYLYNMFSAAHILSKRRVKIKDCYTCAEFGVDVVSCAVPEAGFNCGQFYTIEEIDNILTDYLVSEGSVEPLVKKASWEEDQFPTHLSTYRAFACTLRSNARLVKRLFTK